MMRFTPGLAAALAAVIVCFPHAALAQGAVWTDRGYLNLGGWYQPQSPSFAATVRPIDFAEASVVDTSYRTRSIPGFEASGGLRVWRNLAVGAGVSLFSKNGSGAMTARVPHPFFFNQPRTITGDAAGLARGETAVHVQATWLLPLRQHWDLAIAAGPSWFSVNQDLIADVTVTQTYPYDTAAFAGATTVRRSHAAAGFNAGADLTHRLRPRVGIGFGASFSRAAVRLDDNTSVDAGGAHVGGGIRFRF